MSQLEWENEPKIISAEQGKITDQGYKAYMDGLGLTSPYMDQNKITDPEKHKWWREGYDRALAQHLVRSTKK